MDGAASQFLDVALGLILIFLILSLLCSMAQEILATGLSWRAKFLRRGLRLMLDDDDGKDGGFTDKLLESPFVTEKLKQGRKLGARLNVPAYLPSTTFARSIVERFGWPLEIPDDAPPMVRRKLEALANEAATDLDRFKGNLEEWFDGNMERVSAWYKRRARIVLFALGLFAAAFTNADLIDVTGRLWRDDAVRAAVVAQAERVAAKQDVEAVGESAKQQVEKTGDALAAVKQFDLPLGWNDANGRVGDLTTSFNPKGAQENLLAWLAGVLLTAAALSFGAPFWFNLLSRVARVRGGQAATPRE